jgi:hypothetical protein
VPGRVCECLGRIVDQHLVELGVAHSTLGKKRQKLLDDVAVAWTSVFTELAQVANRWTT